MIGLWVFVLVVVGIEIALFVFVPGARLWLALLWGASLPLALLFIYGVRYCFGWRPRKSTESTQA